MGQTVNLLAYAFGGSNPSLPTKEKSFRQKVRNFFSAIMESKGVLRVATALSSIRTPSLPFRLVI